jgi:hypothetical protein
MTATHGFAFRTRRKAVLATDDMQVGDPCPLGGGSLAEGMHKESGSRAFYQAR